jgi:hypothetical protein
MDCAAAWQRDCEGGRGRGMEAAHECRATVSPDVAGQALGIWRRSTSMLRGDFCPRLSSRTYRWVVPRARWGRGTVVHTSVHLSSWLNGIDISLCGMQPSPLFLADMMSPPMLILHGKDHGKIEASEAHENNQRVTWEFSSWLYFT